MKNSKSKLSNREIYSHLIPSSSLTSIIIKLLGQHIKFSEWEKYFIENPITCEKQNEAWIKNFIAKAQNLPEVLISRIIKENDLKQSTLLPYMKWPRWANYIRKNINFNIQKLEDLSAIKKYEVERVNYANKDISIFHVFKKWPFLKTLNLHMHDNFIIEEEWRHLSYLINLESLTLWSNKSARLKISKIQILHIITTSLSNLTNLDFRIITSFFEAGQNNKKVYDFINFTSLQRLRFLEDFTGKNKIKLPTSLVHLSLDNAVIGPPCMNLNFLSELTNLEALALIQLGFRYPVYKLNNSLNHLIKLKLLDISESYFEFLPCPTNLTNLTYLNLSNKSVNSKDIVDITSSLTNLHALELVGCNLNLIEDKNIL